MLSLVAPYTAEEMWERLGHEPSVALAGWPVVDPALLVEDSVTCVVQVAGKVRDRLEVPPTITRGRAARAGAGVAGPGQGARGARDPHRHRAGAEAGQRRPCVGEPVQSLTADEARLAALWAQGFVDPIDGASAASVARMGQGRRVDLVHAMLRQLGAVQLDTISVLARSHELIPYARFGAIGRSERRGRLLGDRSQLRVLVARRLHPADGVVAAVRVPPALLPQPRHPLARGARLRRARCHGAAPRRGPAHHCAHRGRQARR